MDRAKLVLSSDLARRWTLAEIAADVGVSPVYLTQVFQQFEGLPLYRYQLHLRLARALDLLGDYDDLTRLALDLGFSSHSHFSAAFKQAYGQTPLGFQRRRAGRPRALGLGEMALTTASAPRATRAMSSARVASPGTRRTPGSGG